MTQSALSDESDHESISPSRDYQRIERALVWLTDHYTAQPTLAEAARCAGLSEFHFQRLFCRWVGLTPKKYVQYLTLNHAKASLETSRSVLEAAFDAGLSGPGRLHDLFVTIEAMTPGEYKSGGAGLDITFDFADCAYGEYLIAWCRRGICAVAFTSGAPDLTLEHVRGVLPRATWTRTDSKSRPNLSGWFEGVPAGDTPVKLLLRGSSFEIKVWEALLRIPFGHLTTYAQIARSVGQPNAARAVGRAIGANHVAYLIPCHRVIRGSGVISGYRWGSQRKLAMLTRERLLSAAQQVSAAGQNTAKFG